MQALRRTLPRYIPAIIAVVTLQSGLAQANSDDHLISPLRAFIDEKAVDLKCTGRPATCDEMDCYKGRPMSCSEWCAFMNQHDPTFAGTRCDDNGEGNYDCVCCFVGEECPEPKAPTDGPTLPGPQPSASLS